MKVEDEKFMAKRMLVMLTLTLLFVGALGFVKFKQIQTAIAQGAAYQPPPEAVTTVIAAQEQWPSTINAIGTLAAVRGVTVSADLPGIVEALEAYSRVLHKLNRLVEAGQVDIEVKRIRADLRFTIASQHRG